MRQRLPLVTAPARPVRVVCLACQLASRRKEYVRVSIITNVLTEQFSSMERDAVHGSYMSDTIPEAVFHSQTVKTVAYLRVSTAQQDVCSQRLAILEYARKHAFRIDDFIEATASGQASEKRRRLDELMNVLQRGERLLVSDRRLSSVLRVSSLFDHAHCRGDN